MSLIFKVVFVAAMLSVALAAKKGPAPHECSGYFCGLKEKENSIYSEIDQNDDENR